MYRIIAALLLFATFLLSSFQEKAPIKVPAPVLQEQARRYPQVNHITWETEKGNYEANWGGKSGEDHSVLYKPDGTFLEASDAMPLSGLPKEVQQSISQKFSGAKVMEPARVTDAKGTVIYEVEISHKEWRFTPEGKEIPSVGH